MKGFNFFISVLLYKCNCLLCPHRGITAVYAVGTSQMVKSADYRVLEMLRERHRVCCGILKGISGFIGYEFKDKLCVYFMLNKTPLLTSHFCSGTSLIPCRGNGGNDENPVVIKT